MPEVLAQPLGMRYLTRPPHRVPVERRFEERLQSSVCADGNPWHALADGDTSTETSNGDGSQSGSDAGTDL